MFICFYQIGYNTACATEAASSKKKKKFKTRVQNRYPIYYYNGGKMAKIDTLFMTKTAEKPYPLGPHIPTDIAHITEYPPPPGTRLSFWHLFDKFLISLMASGCTTVHTKDLWNVQFQPVLQTQKTFPIQKVKFDHIFVGIKFTYRQLNLA